MPHTHMLQLSDTRMHNASSVQSLVGCQKSWSMLQLCKCLEREHGMQYMWLRGCLTTSL